MKKYTTDMIATLAANSIFYVSLDGTWLRILHTEGNEGRFHVVDENTGEEQCLTFEEVAAENDPHFERLERARLGNTMRDICITYIKQHRFFKDEFLDKSEDQYILDLYIATCKEQGKL